MDRLRTPFFVVALVAWVLVLLVEVGSFLLPVPRLSETELKQTLAANGDADSPSPSPADIRSMLAARNEKPPRPGYAIQSLAAFDGFVLLGLFWMAIALVLPQGLVGRVQGIVSLILGCFALLGGIVATMALVGLLLTMVGLFLAPPFGTIAYLAIWGFFDRGAAAGTLSLIFVLKVAACILLFLAQQSFVGNKSLVVVLLLSLLLNVVTGLLHGFPPVVLVSITDVIAAIVAFVVEIVWAIVVVVGSLVATIKVLIPK